MINNLWGERGGKLYGARKWERKRLGGTGAARKEAGTRVMGRNETSFFSFRGNVFPISSDMLLR